MQKKISIVIAALIFISSPILTADDGSWSKSFSINGGSIYSEEEHENIALEKELLVFDGESTTAIFQFKNTAPKEVKVSCGFPVMIKIATNFENGYLKIPTGRYGGTVSIPGLEYFETVENRQENEYDEPDFSYHEKIVINAENNRREFLKPSARPESVSFSIEQDGKKVSIDRVLLERNATAADGAWVTFHYKHDLVFPPGKTSNLQVTYSYDMQSGSFGAGMGPSYKWDYIIETGGTWKGPIEEFFFVKPANWSGNIDGIPAAYRDRKMDIFFQKNYEPKKNARFSLTRNTDPIFQYYQDFETLKENCFSTPRPLPVPGSPVQNFVTNIGASSAIAQQVDVFTVKGLIPKMGFKAGSAFDGMPNSAWCEDVKGDGIGEYISWVLTEPVWGLEIQNGYNRILFPDFFFESSSFTSEYENPALGIRDYYALNNRVKILDITTQTGKLLHSLQLKDTRGLQFFPAVLLPPGAYRAVIKDVYHGTAWDDTCLGEITFVTEEAFSADPSIFTGNKFLMNNLREFRF